MISILIVEDSPDIRLSLINILKVDPDIYVAGETDNGFGAVEMAKNLQPNLVLMDIRLPGLDGLEATKQIKTYCDFTGKDIKVLILSTFYDDDYVSRAQIYGIDGFLLKGLAFDKLASAIKSTCNDLVTLDRIIFEKQKHLAIDRANKKAELCCLNETEAKILGLVVNGKNNAEIAGELYYSEGTVRNYISSMLSKLKCKNGRELTAFGIKAGLPVR